MGIFPVDALVDGYIFEHVAHAGLIIGINGMADQSAEHGTNKRTAHHRACTTPLIRADHATQHRANRGTDGIAVAGGIAVAIAVIIIAIDRVITGIGAVIIIITVSSHWLNIERLRNRHHMMDVPIDDDWSLAVRLVVAVIAIPGAILVDRLVGPAVRSLMMAGVTAIPVAMVGTRIGMALRCGPLLIAMILMLPVDMLLRRTFALPLRFPLLLMLATIAIILFGSLALGVTLLIEHAVILRLLLPLLPLLVCLPLIMTLLLLVLLLDLLISLTLLPLAPSLLMHPFLPDVLVTLAL